MATRFYLQSVLGAPVSPAFDAGWTDATALVRAMMYPDKKATPMVTRASPTLLAVTADQYLGMVQYISRPLAKQTIPGLTLVNAGHIRAIEGSTLDNLNSLPLTTKLFHAGGGFEVLAALGQKSSNPEFDTVLESRRFYATGLFMLDSQVDTPVLEGDRLIFEFGIRNTGLTAIGAIGSVSVGDDAATDLPIDLTTQTALNPWIEFDYTFQFLNREMLGMMGMG